MQNSEILGYLLSLIMGLTLGLFGGGGSILTVPILVYVMSIEPVLATAYSLFVVGSSAAIGSLIKLKNKEIDIKTSLIFALPSIAAVYFTRRLIIPALPDTLFHLGDFAVNRDLALMVLFAVVMLVAGLSMIRKKKQLKQSKKMKYPAIVLDGLLVGFITGLIGAGGGFLIVPALVLLAGMEIKVAIASSLLIISMKSLIGFLGDIGSGQTIDWTFLISFTAIAAVGMVLGIRLNKKVKADKLKTSFGYFILAMALLVAFLEFTK